MNVYDYHFRHREGLLVLCSLLGSIAAEHKKTYH